MEWPDNRFEYLPHIQSLMGKGWGCRRGNKYHGWRDFRSRARNGTEQLIQCSKTGRQVNHKSIAHRVFFLLQERRSCVISIEEEFPLLNIPDMLKICARLGLKHPEKKGLIEPFVVSFLVREIRDGEEIAVARTLSRESPEAGQPVSELDAIQQGCKLLGLDWMLVDATVLDSETMLSSLMFAREWMKRMPKADPDEAARFAGGFLKQYRRSDTLKGLLATCSANLDMTVATANSLFRCAAWKGLIPVDFQFTLALNEPVHLLKHG